MTSRRLMGAQAVMSNADAFDILFGHPPARRSQRVFITRTAGGKVLAREMELLASGEFEPVVARERDMAGGRLLYDLIEQMRGCDTAIIHVTAGTAPKNADRQPRISDEVLIEIGAAMALYGREFILLVEDGVELPPCLRGLCECRYTGKELNMPVVTRLLRALGCYTKWPSEGPPAASDVRYEAAAKH
jgi:predicted nucleotide-binding protein